MAVQRTSSKGRAFIAHEEGLIPYAYNDPVGFATFGVGHLLHRSGVTRADRIKWGTKRFPRPRALAMLVFKADLKQFEKAVRHASGGGKLRQCEFDALVSLAYNIGTGGIASSTVERDIRMGRGHGHFKAAADAFLMWDKPNILRPRRERERRLFLTGEY